MTQKPPTPEELSDFKDDLSRYYGVWDADQFASYVLDRTVRADQLTRDELREVLAEARAAYRPYEEAWIDVQNARVDALTAAQAVEQGASWLR